MKWPTRAPCFLIILAPSKKQSAPYHTKCIDPRRPQSVHRPSAVSKLHPRSGLPGADGERIENEAFATDDRAWCAINGVSALELDRSWTRSRDEIEAVCDRARSRLPG